MRKVVHANSTLFKFSSAYFEHIKWHWNLLFSFINWNQFEDNMYFQCLTTNIFCNIYHFWCKNNFCKSDDDKLKSLVSIVKSRDRVRAIIKHLLKHFTYLSLFTFHHNPNSIFDCIYLSMPIFYLFWMQMSMCESGYMYDRQIPQKKLF